MLIHYKDRHSILFKAISVALVCLFAINDFAWAQDYAFSVIARRPKADEAISKTKTLAPHTQLLDPAFREKFNLAEAVLSFEGVRHYIKEQVEREKKDVFKTKGEWKKHRTEIIEDINSSPLLGRIKSRADGPRSVVFVKLAAFLSSAVQPAAVDLTGEIDKEIFDEFGGIPVVYIDSTLCNTPDKGDIFRACL